MNYNVLIVGSGLGGLECGTLLAKQGLKVLVLEASNQPGGCMQSFRRGGLHYDTGLHYVGGLAAGQAMHKAFAELGLMVKHSPKDWQRISRISGKHSIATFGDCKTSRSTIWMSAHTSTCSRHSPTNCS